MAKMLICYYSRTRHTEHMAEAVEAGAAEVAGVEVVRLPVNRLQAEDLLKYDAIVLGSPTYYGTMAAEMKQLIDDSVAFHGRLAGKVGGAFASSANLAGGSESTVLDLLHTLLIHGMVVQGSATGGHYGPVSIGDVDDRARGECRRLGRSTAELAVKLHG